jgi:PPOX class probable F420-dependent enzyme
MSANIPESHIDLIEGPVFAILTTVTADGQPQNAVMWCSWDGDQVLVNTRGASKKVKNIRSNPKVALIAVDPQNPFRWVDVRGEVESIREDIDFENINSHAKLYMNVDEFYGNVAPIEQKGKEDRVVLRITPKQVFAYAP